MRGLEGPFLHREVALCVARLTNLGTISLRSLRLLVSEPDLFCCATQAFLHQKLSSLGGKVSPSSLLQDLGLHILC